MALIKKKTLLKCVKIHTSGVHSMGYRIQNPRNITIRDTKRHLCCLDYFWFDRHAGVDTMLVEKGILAV